MRAPQRRPFATWTALHAFFGEVIAAGAVLMILSEQWVAGVFLIIASITTLATIWLRASLAWRRGWLERAEGGRS